MGTRNLVALYLDGTHRIAQYGQWDGYPSGQGTTVLKFLRDRLCERSWGDAQAPKLNFNKMEAFKQKLRQSRFATEDEVELMWMGAGAEKGASLVSMDVSERMDVLYPALSRNTGGEILELVFRNEPGIRLKDSISFAADGLFCEWAYVVDLDTEKFEVYQGFNRGEGGRFAHLGPTDSKGEYQPVGLRKIYDLNNLPTEEQFLADFKEPDEEEE